MGQEREGNAASGLQRGMSETRSDAQRQLPSADEVIVSPSSTPQQHRTNQNQHVTSGSTITSGKQSQAIPVEPSLEDSLIPIADMGHKSGTVRASSASTLGSEPADLPDGAMATRATASMSSGNHQDTHGSTTTSSLEHLETLPEIAQKFFMILGDIDNELTRYLRALHGVPVLHSNGILEFPNSNGTPITVSSNGSSALGSGNPGGSWANSIAARYRVTEEPVINPENDETLQAVLQRPHDMVHVLILGINNMEGVQDAESTEARLVRETDPELVTATCKLILTALIHRCVLGYCGNKKRNKAHHDDRKLLCSERFIHIYHALREEKTLCRDVLQEDSDIASLVNAPVTALRTKKNQRHTNDKRRIKDETLKKELQDFRQQLHLPTQDSQTALQDQEIVAMKSAVPSGNSKGKRKRSKAKRDPTDEENEASGLQPGP